MTKPSNPNSHATLGSGHFGTLASMEEAGSIGPPVGTEPTVDFDSLGTILDRFGIANKATIAAIVGQSPESSLKAIDRLVAKKHLTQYQASILREKGPEGLQFGEYLLVDTLGAGGMGEVFKGKNLALGRMEAIKTIRAEQGIGELLMKRFKQEARLLALLEHANFVPIYRSGRVGDVDFIAMRFVEGETLKSKIDAAAKQKTPLPWRDVCRWFVDAARAIDYAHQSGVIHRDLKPSNLMIGPRGNIVVLDMGIARLVDDGSTPAGEALTATSRALGTPEYMPPEQWADARAVNQTSDVYSMGVSLFHTLTLQIPFSTHSLTDLMLAHTSRQPPKASSIRKDLPRGLDAIIDKCLAKNPADRFASMAEFANALEKLDLKGAVSLPQSSATRWLWPALAIVGISIAAIAVFWKRDHAKVQSIHAHAESAKSSASPSAENTTPTSPAASPAPTDVKKTPTPDPAPVPKPPVDWLAEYAKEHAADWQSPAELRSFALRLAGNDSTLLNQRTPDLLRLLDAESKRRHLEKLEPFKFLTAEATEDDWSAAALAAIRSILAVHGRPEDHDLSIVSNFVDLEGKPLERIQVGQRFQVAVRPSKDAYITFVQVDGGFLFVFPFPKLIPANETLALTNVLAFGSPGQKSFMVYATDRVLVDKLVKPDSDDVPRLPKLFATKDAFERLDSCLRDGRPVNGVEPDSKTRYWSRTIVHLEVVSP